MEYEDLKPYNKEQLVRIATYNELYKNEYYISKLELQMALYTCLLSGNELVIPEF